MRWTLQASVAAQYRDMTASRGSRRSGRPGPRVARPLRVLAPQACTARGRPVSGQTDDTGVPVPDGCGGGGVRRGRGGVHVGQR